MTRHQLLGAGTRLVTEHRIAGPLLLGVGAGVALLLPFGGASVLKNAALGAIASLTFIVVFISTAGLGSILRRGGHGRAGFLMTAAGMVAPIVLAVFAFAQPPADSTCPSCYAEGLFFAGPWLLAMLMAPMAIGYWRAGRAMRNGPVA